MKTNIVSPILTEPELIAVTNPFGSTQPTGTDAIGWYRKLAGEYDGWATYKHVSKDWWLWKNFTGNVLNLTQSAPDVGDDGDYYAKTITGDVVNFQGVYGCLKPPGPGGIIYTLDVYIWSPFDIILSRIIEILRLHPDLADLIKPGNTIDISGGGVFTVTKERKSTADLPEITIEPIGGGHGIVDSTSALVTQKYGITLLAGEEVVSRYYFPVKWALVQALMKFLEPKAGGLLDLFFVTDTKINSISDSAGDVGPRRSEFALEVKMYIDRSVLRGT